jgi:hypothetical protein
MANSVMKKFLFSFFSKNIRSMFRTACMQAAAKCRCKEGIFLQLESHADLLLDESTHMMIKPGMDIDVTFRSECGGLDDDDDPSVNPSWEVLAELSINFDQETSTFCGYEDDDCSQDDDHAWSEICPSHSKVQILRDQHNAMMKDALKSMKKFLGESVFVCRNRKRGVQMVFRSSMEESGCIVIAVFDESIAYVEMNAPIMEEFKCFDPFDGPWCVTMLVRFFSIRDISLEHSWLTDRLSHYASNGWGDWKAKWALGDNEILQSTLSESAETIFPSSMSSKDLYELLKSTIEQKQKSKESD